MECPICCNGDHVEVDTHADGFAGNLFECGSCETVWTLVSRQIKVLHIDAKKKVVGQRPGVCPFCHEANHVELDMHSDGFAGDLLECGDCGAVWSGMAADITVLHGPISGNTFSISHHQR
ncbi:MAG: hypothetical protein K0A93_12250 [Desulfuromonadaceae bacterium]|nr:hypothetical protein [Desulfuromonadaceae bacterium]